MKQVRTRVAPSPTGYPHIGTAFQALFDYVVAKKHKGKFVIRIEDTDVKREVKGAEEVIYEGLEWLGLTPDEGPKYGGKFGPYRQSERLNWYQQYAQELVDKGKAYYCFCSSERLAEMRKKQQKEGKPPMYDGHCRGLDKEEAEKRAKTEKYVIRLKVPDDEVISFRDGIRGEIKFESKVVDDQVLLKSDGYPTYHLAVVVDDHLMEISHVIRGEEWMSSTPKHILLYRYLDWPIPEIIHLPLLRNPDRSKISKRHGHTSIFWYRDEGYLVEAVVNFLATRVWNHPEGKEIFKIEELIDLFEFKDMHVLGPIVDLDKLNWLNGQWIRRISDEELLERLEEFRPEKLTKDFLRQILPLIKERLEKLNQLEELTSYLVTEPKIDEKLMLKEARTDKEKVRSYLAQVEEKLKLIDDWSAARLEEQLRKFQQEVGWKPRPAFMTVRIAVTGRVATPPLFETMELIGKDKVLKRLSYAQEIFKN